MRHQSAIAFVIVVILMGSTITQAQSEPIHAREVWRTELTYPPEATVDDTEIYSFAWSPDQSQLLVLVCGYIYLLDGETGAIEARFDTGDVFVNASDGSPVTCPKYDAIWNTTGTQIAVLRWADGIDLINTATSTRTLMIGETRPYSRWLEYLTDSQLIALYRGDGGYFAVVWDTQSHSILNTIPTIATDNLSAMSLYNDTAYIPQSDGGIRQIALPSGEQLQSFDVSINDQHPAIPYISPDKQSIVFGYGNDEGLHGLAIYDTITQETYVLRQSDVGDYSGYRGLGWSPDGAYFATTAARGDDPVTIWDAQSLEAVIHVDNVVAPYGYLDIQWHPDSSAILLSNGIRIPYPCEVYGCDTVVQVMAVPSGEVTHVLQGHQKTVNYALWSADGTRVVTASEDGTVRLWDLTQEADYSGCDPSNQFLPGTLVWFALRDDGLSGYAAPGDEEAVTSLNNNRRYVVSDGPRCIDGVDWYQVTPQLLEDDVDLLLSEVRYYWLPVQPGDMMREE